jgi:hypothetical protein
LKKRRTETEEYYNAVGREGECRLKQRRMPIGEEENVS